MALFFLTNTVRFGIQVFYAGVQLDNVQDPALVATVQAAGGLLYPATDPIVAAAAVLAQTRRLQGAPIEELDSLMSAGVNKSQEAALAGSNTVDNTTATNQNATAVSQNETATNQDASVGTMESFPDLAAGGVNYVAQYAAGAPINDAVGPFNLVNPLPRRTVRAVLGAAGANPVNLHIEGFSSIDGSPLSDDLVLTGAGTYEGFRAFESITLVQTDVDPLDTLDIQTGDGFAVGAALFGAPVLAVNGAVSGVNSAHSATGTVVPATPPNGALDFLVKFNASHTHTQNAHTHLQNAHTHLQNAHTHTLS